MAISNTPSPLSNIIAAKTYNAAWFSGATKEAQITAAIAAAVTDGALYVFIPANMLPYNAAQVTFNTAIHMLAEGLTDASVYNPKCYGAYADGVTDDLVPINTARAGAVANGATLSFSGATYGLSDTVNFGYNNLQIRAQGRVIFKRVGVANATPVLSIDSGGNTASLVNITMLGDFCVYGNATTTKGLYTRGCHHSKIELRVLNGAGIGAHIAWSVLSRFDIIVSINDPTAAMPNPPSIGVQVDLTQAGFYTADSLFWIIVEGIGAGATGLYVKQASGCEFKGSCEGSPLNKGVVEDAGCNRNTFDNFWCEANITSDFEISGGSTTLVNCNANSPSASANVLANGNGLIAIRGYIRWINLVGSDTLFDGVKFDNNPAAGIKGSGTYKSIGSLLVDGTLAITARVQDYLGFTNVQRIIGYGTPHVAGDYVLSAGWGNTAVVRINVGGTNWNARDTGGNVVFQANGAGIAANPTVVLTFKDGGFIVPFGGFGTARPVVVCSRGEDVAPAGVVWNCTDTTTTTATFQFRGLPVAGNSYILNFIVQGI